MFLAYKAMAYNEEGRYFHPPLLPEWRMPAYSVIDATCEHDHAIPNPDCNCGIQLTTDLSQLKPYIELAVPDQESVLVFTFQVLGKVLYDAERSLLRAERAFPYGLVVTNQGHGRDWVGKRPVETLSHPITVARQMRVDIEAPDYAERMVLQSWRNTREAMRSRCPEWIADIIRSWKSYQDFDHPTVDGDDLPPMDWLLQS